MGYYIEVPQPKGKAKQLVDLYKAKEIPQPRDFVSISNDIAIICVVDNGRFEAAGYCYSSGEFLQFARPDGRPKQWLIMNKSLANKLTRFGC